MTAPRPHRPAILSAADADAIPGDPDPADRAEAAHASAAALLDGGRNASDPAVVQRLVRLVQDEGIEEIARLWANSPPTTLPGTLWRLYVVHTWVASDPAAVAERYRLGESKAPVSQVVAGVATPPGPDEVRQTLDTILTGIFTGDFAVALERAAAFCRIVAYGAGHLDDGPDDRATATAARRAGRLLTTADELQAAATLHRAGKLS